MQKKNETPHDNKARDELEELARKIANCDNPNCTTCPANAKLIQAHIDKARLEEVWKFPGRIKGGPGVPASAWFEIGNAKDIRIAELEARLKSDKDKQ